MIGDRLGRWTLHEEIGHGGMGRVFLARDPLTGDEAAVKVLTNEGSREKGFLERFRREIDTLRKLHHPHIVRFHESGLENQTYFYAMEYVEGKSLQQIINEKKRLPWKEGLHLAWQLCRALRHVHDHEIIHRDIKPSNILITRDGTLKLTDFGIAKVFVGPQLTATGGVVGTAEYLSPEQACGKPVTRRSDLYSFGAVLYEILTGRPPFLGPSIPALLQKHRFGQFDPPRRYIPEIPQELDDLVTQMLEKDPEKRPSDCTAVGKKIERIAHKYANRSDPGTDVATRPTLADKQIVHSTMPNDEKDEAENDRRRTLPAVGRSTDLEDTLSKWFNQPWVLVTLLALCLGILVYTFWPEGQDALFEKGAALMESSRWSDRQSGWHDYLEPLNRRFPDHPYRDQVEKYRLKLESNALPSEVERWLLQAELLAKTGKDGEARALYLKLLETFGEVPAERLAMVQARKGLSELDHPERAKKRLESLTPTLDHAAELQRKGKTKEADAIWSNLLELYRNDPLEPILKGEIAKRRS